MSNLILSAGLIWPFTWLASIALAIDTLVYYIVHETYQIFSLVAQAQLFSDPNGIIKPLTDRIYSILGIIMLFVFTYNILLLIINPDKLNDKSDSSMLGIIKNLIISLILIVLLPTMFGYAYRIQNSILNSGVLSSIFMGGTTSDENNNLIRDGGRVVALNLFSAFYYPIDTAGTAYSYEDCTTKSDAPAICSDYVSAMDSVMNDGNLFAFTENKTLKKGLENDQMRYTWFISFCAGVFAAYLFISFTIDVGVRVVKLGLLQVIAPIPIVMRITKPKGGVFDKWFKETTKTFLMVFERLIVIYFAMWTISSVICSDKGGIIPNLNSDGSTGAFAMLFAKVFLILGTLAFAKEAPKMMEDLFGMKIGNVSIKKKLGQNEYAMRGAAMIGTGGAKGIGNYLNARKSGKSFVKALGASASGLATGGIQGFRQSKGLNDLGKLKNTVVIGKGVADANEQKRLDKKQAMYDANKIEQWENNSKIKAMRDSKSAEYLSQHGDIYQSGDWQSIHDEIFSNPNLSETEKVALYEQKVSEYNESLKNEAETYARNKVYNDTYADFKPAFGTTAAYTRKYKATKNREKMQEFFTGTGGKTIYDANVASMDNAINSLKQMKEAVSKLGAETMEKQFSTASNDPNYTETIRNDLKGKREFERNKAAMKLFDEKLTSYGTSYLESLKKSISDNPQAFANSTLKVDDLEKMVNKINDKHDEYFDSSNNLTAAGKSALETEFKDLYKTINDMQISINNDKIKKTTEWATEHRNDKKDS